MTKDSLGNQLRSFYARTKRQVNLGNSELVLHDLFGIDNLGVIVNEQYEDVYFNRFVALKIDMEKRILFSYSDVYDFLNTMTKIDTNDLMIFFTFEEIQEFSVSLMSVLNKAFNNWAQNRKSGFRKGTRIFFEMDKVGIHLFLKPEIKV